MKTHVFVAFMIGTQIIEVMWLAVIMHRLGIW